MSVTIRPMVAADIEAVREVAHVTWARTYREIIPEAAQVEFLRRAYSDDMLRRRMAQHVFLVALWEERIVGFADFRRLEPGRAELSSIYVLPEAQGSGVGSDLLAAGLRALPDVVTLRLDVDRENRSGQRFYAAKGFVVSGETSQEFAGHTLPLLTMTWHRPPPDAAGSLSDR